MGGDYFILPIPVFSLRYAPTVSLTVFTYQCEQLKGVRSNGTFNEQENEIKLEFFLDF